MASVTLVRTISFSIYQKAKYTYSAAIGRAIGEEPLVTVNRPGSIPTLGTVLCFGAAGATAGGMVAIIACMRDLFEALEVQTLICHRSLRVDKAIRANIRPHGRPQQVQRARPGQIELPTERDTQYGEEYNLTQRRYGALLGVWFSFV